MTAIDERPVIAPPVACPEIVVAECGHYRLAKSGVPFGEHYTTVGAAIAALGLLETAVAA